MSTKLSTIQEHIISATHIKNLANHAMEGSKKKDYQKLLTEGPPGREGEG